MAPSLFFVAGETDKELIEINETSGGYCAGGIKGPLTQVDDLSLSLSSHLLCSSSVPLVTAIVRNASTPIEE